MTEIVCDLCGVKFEKGRAEIARTKHNFCSRSCAGSFNNQRRRGPYKNRDKEYREARGLRKIGYGYRTIAGKLGIPPDTIRNWVNDIKADPGKAYKLSSMPKPFEKLKSSSAKRKRLIAELGNSCEGCGIDNWLGDPIVIELHHIDGNKDNGPRENLMLLCPNCHSQTDNFKNKRR